jgi:hypothetical protein
MTDPDYTDVDRAIRWAVSGASGLRAVDPERLASRVSWDRPNPRRIPTVRKTGHEGSPARYDPLDAVARGRMRALLAELGDVREALVVGAAFGVSQRGVLRWLRCRGLSVSNDAVGPLTEGARQTLVRRMAEVGLT